MFFPAQLWLCGDQETWQSSFQSQEEEVSCSRRAMYNWVDMLWTNKGGGGDIVVLMKEENMKN